MVSFTVNGGRDVSGEGNISPQRGGNGNLDKGAARTDGRGDSGAAARSDRQGECSVTSCYTSLLFLLCF